MASRTPVKCDKYPMLHTTSPDHLTTRACKIDDYIYAHSNANQCQCMFKFKLFSIRSQRNAKELKHIVVVLKKSMDGGYKVQDISFVTKPTRHFLKHLLISTKKSCLPNNKLTFTIKIWS